MRPLPVLALACLLLGGPPLAAQGVLVAPHSIIMDHRTRSGFVELYNPESRPIEVTISTLYGYPVTDSLGLLFLHEVAAPDSTAPSATAWVQALPRRMIIPPLTKQTVRLLGRPPATLPDGEYWTRLVITAKAGQLPVSGADSAAGITVGLNLEVRTILPVYYRKGATGTALRVTATRATAVADSIVVRTRLAREGNAAYIGTVRAALLDAGNRAVAQFAMPIAVYYTIEPRFALPRAGLPPGRYRLQLEVAAERSDIPPEQLLRAPAARDSAVVILR